MPTFHLTRLGAFAMMLVWVTMLAWGVSIVSKARSLRCYAAPSVSFNIER